MDSDTPPDAPLTIADVEFVAFAVMRTLMTKSPHGLIVSYSTPHSGSERHELVIEPNDEIAELLAPHAKVDYEGTRLVTLRRIGLGTELRVTFRLPSRQP